MRRLAAMRAFFWRFPQVFISHHLRLRLWLTSKNAARQVGDAHRVVGPREGERTLNAGFGAQCPRCRRVSCLHKGRSVSA